MYSTRSVCPALGFGEITITRGCAENAYQVGKGAWVSVNECLREGQRKVNEVRVCQA